MKNIKEFINKIKNKNTATSVGASSARPYSKARPHTKTILITLPILFLIIAALIAIGITNAANSTTEPETEQTFTEEGNGYYIWVRAVDHAGNKGPWSEAQRVWIDASGPSAPVIQGGSTAYALSRTISVKTESDDNGASGVAYYEYYKKSGANKPAANAEGTKVTTSATSQKFDTNTAGDYVFFRAVDVVGNKGAWSEGQQVYIDVNSPTVKAKNSSATISKGTSKEMSSFFTVSANGNATVSAVYKIGSTSYTNTSSLAMGTYTVTCTATKSTGTTSSASMTLVVAPGVDSNGLATANTTIKPSASSNVQIVIPKGWAPAILEESNSTTSLPTQSGKVKSIMPASQWNSITIDQINQGIVIVNGTTDFEEYVWVPVPDSSSFKLTAWTSKYITMGADAANGQHPITSEYKETGGVYWDVANTALDNSVQTYKGFYIGRYEASQKSSTVAQSKRGQTPWNNITRANALTYCSNSAITNSHLIYDREWDYALNWFIGNAKITSSNTTMTLSDIQTSSVKWGNHSGATGGAETSSGTARTTGYSEYWKANNIYDLSGNYYEMTQGGASTGGCWTVRGGFASGSWYNTAALRSWYNGARDFVGFRMCFYL